jgi:hypothetical protein
VRFEGVGVDELFSRRPEGQRADGGETEDADERRRARPPAADECQEAIRPVATPTSSVRVGYKRRRRRDAQA